MNTLIQAFLTAIANLCALAFSFEPANAGAYQTFFVNALATAQTAQIGKATPMQFVTAGLAVASTGTAAFGNTAEQKLAADINVAIGDLQNGKDLAAVLEAVTIYKDGKAAV